MSSSQGRPRLDALSSLRFFAAVYIFLFHATAMHIVERLRAPRWFPYACNVGYIAVSFFFVLSGFVLVYGYGDREIGSWWKFMRARVARIYPAYLLGLLFTSWFFLAINLADVPDFRWFARHQVLTAVSHMTMMQAWIPQAVLGWNMPGWAVSVFMAYYAAFPWISRKMRDMKTSTMFTIVTIAWLCSVGVAIAYELTSPDGVHHVDQAPLSLVWLNFVKFNPVMRLSEFLMGVVLGFTVLRQAPTQKRAAASMVSGLALLVLVIGVSKWVPYVVMHTGLSAPAFALIIYGLSVPSRWSAWLTVKPLTALGDASLSFYLMHSIFIGAGFMFRGTGPTVPVTWLRLVIILALAAGFSLVLHRWWETPGRKVFDPPAKPKVKVPEPAVA